MKMTYTAPDRQVFTLIGENPNDYRDVFVAHQSIEGLAGTVENEGLQVTDVAGTTIIQQDNIVQPLTGTLTIVGATPEGLLRFCRQWSTRREGVLTVAGLRSLSLPVRLATPIMFPPSKIRRGSQATVEVVSDRGWWGEFHSASGEVTVENLGDVWIWPTLRWSSRSGTLVMPSGTEYSIPAMDGEHLLSFAPNDSGRVVHAETRVVNREVSEQIGLWGEGIPPGETATYVVPPGAKLDYEIGFLSPWQRL